VLFTLLAGALRARQRADDSNLPFFEMGSHVKDSDDHGRRRLTDWCITL